MLFKKKNSITLTVVDGILRTEVRMGDLSPAGLVAFDRVFDRLADGDLAPTLVRALDYEDRRLGCPLASLVATSPIREAPAAGGDEDEGDGLDEVVVEADGADQGIFPGE